MRRFSLAIGIVSLVLATCSAAAGAGHQASWTAQALATCRATTLHLDQLERPDFLLTAAAATLTAEQARKLDSFFDETSRLKASNVESLRKLSVPSDSVSKVQAITAALAEEAQSYRDAARSVVDDKPAFLRALTDAAQHRADALRAAERVSLVPCAVLGGFGKPSEAQYTDLGSGVTFKNVCGDATASTTLSCDAPHAVEQFGGFILNGKGRDFPGRDTLVAVASEGCGQQFSAYVGIDTSSSVFKVTTLTPNSTAWAQGDYSVYCLLALKQGQTIIGSAFKVEQ